MAHMSLSRPEFAYERWNLVFVRFHVLMNHAFELIHSEAIV